MTVEQDNRSTLLTSVAVAGITSGVGISINVATGEHGGVLSWVVLVLLTAALGLAPFVSNKLQISKKVRRGTLRILVIATCLVVVYSTVSDIPREQGSNQESNSSTSFEGDRRTAATLPRGVVNPSSLDPDAEKVVVKLTTTFQESDLLPEEIRLEKGNAEYHLAPLEFFIDGDEFMAVANLRDSLGVVYLTVRVFWSEGQSTGGGCPPESVGVYCESINLDDGSRVSNVVYWEKRL